MKVKAHTGWDEALSRLISPRHQYGNWLADAAAKSSARYSEAQSSTASFGAEIKKAIAWMKWAARCAADWIDDIEPEAALATRAHECSPRKWEYGAAHLRHELWAVGRRATCRRCGLSQANPERQAASFSWRSEGFAAGRAAAQSTGNVNHIWAQAVHSRAQLLRCGARLLEAEPPPRWMVELESLHEVARSDEHLRTLKMALSKQRESGPHAEHLSAPPWLLAPTWMAANLEQPWEKLAEALRRHVGCTREKLDQRDHGHRVAFVSSMAYCSRCACFAQKRVGSRFKGVCQLPVGRAASAVNYRLARLRSGLHPITGLPLSIDSG